MRLALLALLAHPALGGPTGLAAAQAPRPSAGELVDQGWRFLPQYDGAHRASLGPDELRDVQAGAHLFAAAAALDPHALRTLWSLGHAHVLLAEDRKTRGLLAEAREHHARALEALSRALELDPDDPWAAYARGAAHASFGALTSALADLERASASAAARIPASGPDGWDAKLRFRALEWRAEVLVRSGLHERARAALREFHAEFSSNAFPLRRTLADDYLRERDLAAARAEYAALRAEFPSDPQAYEWGGNVEGLLGDRERATKLLQDAIAREREPDLYKRLWLWILATDVARDAARRDLADFLAHPPSSTGEWDLALGRFALGAGSADAFVEDARAEELRRMDASQPVGDLLCEVWFYVGLRHEHDAAGLADEPACSALLEAALAAHQSALALAPVGWKWEWSFARLHQADLAARLGRAAAPGFALEGTRLVLGADALALEALAWHAPRAARPVASLERAPRPGDLLLARAVRSDGERVGLTLVVGAR